MFDNHRALSFPR